MSLEDKYKAGFSLKKFFRENKIILLLLTFLVFASYINALGNEFVSDDKGFMLHVPSYTLGHLLSNPFSFLRSLLYLVLYKIVGFEPFVFRLFNVLFHLGSVWLIFLIVGGLLKNRITGIFSASLFAVHPILVESVTWISGGIYVQYSFFFLLSFFIYILSGYRKKMYYFWSLLFFAVSLLSSEKAVVLCLVFIFYEVCFGSIKKHWKKTVVFSFFSFTHLFILLSMGTLGAKISGLQIDQSADQSFYNPLMQIPIAITSYIQLIFWPDGLTLYHSEMTLSALEFGIRVVVFLLILGSMVFAYKRNRHIFFWLSFFVITLIPTLTPFGISWIVAERYVYIGSIGIFVITALLLEKMSTNKSRKMIVYAIFSFIILSLMVRTVARNMDWQNEDNLWLAAARTSPSSSQNHNNLGDYYGRHGDLINSEREFKKAIELKPNYADAYHNLGNVYRDMGKSKLAIQNYEKAYAINPRIWQSYQNIAGIYFAQEDYGRSEEYLQKGLLANPENVNLLTGLGMVNFKQGNKREAKKTFLHVLSIDPNNTVAKQVLLQL